LAKVSDLSGKQSLMRERGMTVKDLDGDASSRLNADLLLTSKDTGELPLSKFAWYPLTRTVTHHLKRIAQVRGDCLPTVLDLR
jgi:hypothetical protein